MSNSTHIPQATPGRSTPMSDSLDAAAEAFRKLPSLKQGTPEPREVKPKVEPVAEETPETVETEPVAEETPAVEGDEPQPEPEETEEPEVVEEEPAEETETEEPEPTVRSRKLKLPDGTEEEVTEDEAYKGYLRTADYTRKTQAAAEKLKAAEAVEAKAREGLALYAAQLEQVKQAMDSIVPKEPDWSALRGRVTPEEFAATHAEWSAFAARRNAVIEEQKRVAAKQKEDFDTKLQGYVRDESAKLIREIPDWADESKARTELGAIKAYAMSQGWSEEEINAVVDSRQILAWRNAMLWAKLQSGKPVIQGKVQQKSKLKPSTPGSAGSRTKPAPVTDEKRDRASLAKAGTLDAAASVFSHVLRRTPALTPRRVPAK